MGILQRMEEVVLVGNSSVVIEDREGQILDVFDFPLPCVLFGLFGRDEGGENDEGGIGYSQMDVGVLGDPCAFCSSEDGGGVVEY